MNRTDPLGMSMRCEGKPPPPPPPPANGPPPGTSGKCKDDGQQPDLVDEVVITAKKQKKLKLKGEEEYISVDPQSLTFFTFGPEHSWDCGNFISNSASKSMFKGGDPGHTHPDGSPNPDENTKPELGPDDGLAARDSPRGRAYKISPKGIVRVERSAHGTYSATLVAGQFEQSHSSVVGTLSAYNRNNGSLKAGGATASGISSGQCQKIK